MCRKCRYGLIGDIWDHETRERKRGGDVLLVWSLWWCGNEDGEDWVLGLDVGWCWMALL